MTTKERKAERREKFINAFNSLTVDNPLTDFQTKTGYNKGNLSKILNRKLYASDDVVKMFE